MLGPAYPGVLHTSKICQAITLQGPGDVCIHTLRAMSNDLSVQYTLTFFIHKPADPSCWCNLHQVWGQALVQPPQPLILQSLPYNIKHTSILERHPTHALSLYRQHRPVRKAYILGSQAAQQRQLHIYMFLDQQER